MTPILEGVWKFPVYGESKRMAKLVVEQCCESISELLLACVSDSNFPTDSEDDLARLHALLLDDYRSTFSFSKITKNTIDANVWSVIMVAWYCFPASIMKNAASYSDEQHLDVRVVKFSGDSWLTYADILT